MRCKARCSFGGKHTGTCVRPHPRASMDERETKSCAAGEPSAANSTLHTIARHLCVQSLQAKCAQRTAAATQTLYPSSVEMLKCDTSHVTRHTSHVTRHTSHVTCFKGSASVELGIKLKSQYMHRLLQRVGDGSEGGGRGGRTCCRWL
jgi:hypothetical protein